MTNLVPADPVKPSSERADTFRLFDRPKKPGSFWWRIFRDIFTSSSPVDRCAVAVNWTADHRVSPDRETAEIERSGSFDWIMSSEDWWEATYLYFQKEICRSSDPNSSGPHSAYLRSANEPNRIRVKIAEFDRLVHVGCLNSLLRWASRSKRAASVDRALRRLLGTGLPARPAGELRQEWFDGQADEFAQALLTQGQAAVRETAGLLTSALDGTEPPWWACFAQEVQDPIESGDAAVLCAALGLGHRKPGEWLIVWQYPAGSVSPLYRPTVLETNNSPFHYPSPPEYKWGVTMPLSPSLPACREILHRPLRGAEASEWCTGQIVRLEDFPLVEYDDLRRLRVVHRERLRSEFSTDSLEDWLSRHPDL